MKLTDLIELIWKDCEWHTLTMFSFKIKKMKWPADKSHLKDRHLYIRVTFVHLKLIHFYFLKETTVGVHILLRKYQFPKPHEIALRTCRSVFICVCGGMKAYYKRILLSTWLTLCCFTYAVCWITLILFPH